MSYEDEFCSDPKEFMEKHVVRAGGVPSDVAESDVVRLGVTLANNFTVKNSFWQSAKVFNLVVRETQSIRAYVCPYADNQLKAIMLGNNAEWMFTATMNGCTFGIGSQGPRTGGSVRVIHVNDQAAATGAATKIQSLSQRMSARNYFFQKDYDLSKITLIEPSDYQGRSNQNESTTFGMHKHGKPWKFYTHRYKLVGNDAASNIVVMHKGVHRHV